MTAIIIQIATALAEAYLAKRLGGIRIKLNSSELQELATRSATKKAVKLTAKERKIRDQLAKIRPAPQKGALAYCSRGFLGLITSSEPVLVRYPDGSEGEAWVGIQLGEPAGKAPGGPWSSRSPRVVAHVRNFEA